MGDRRIDDRESPTRSTTQTLRVEDVLGELHEFAHAPQRVISLVPSITETLFDLGVGDSLIGITDYCIFPEKDVEGIEKLGGTKNPDLDRIETLAPDLVHVNVEENLPRHARRIRRHSPVFASEPKTLADVAELIRKLGDIHDAGERALEWTARLEDRRSALQGRERFSFVVPIWKDPWMWCGGDTYVSNLVSAAGGRNLLARHDRYPRIPLETVLAMEPDFLWLPDEPYPFEESDAEELSALAGERTGIVGPFPGHLFTWHGTRMILGLEFLLRQIEHSGEDVAPAGSETDAPK